MNYNTAPFKSIDVIKHIMWLAWQNSQVFGMGFLRDNPDATKDEVWDNITNSGDYPESRNKKANILSSDYVFGRCMKLTLSQIDENTIDIPDYSPNPEYQSWARKYPKFADLFHSAMTELATNL